VIPFFRRLRGQFLYENRFSRYLLYALGEIVLVVIGILIALQINTWNQDRILQKEETGYLKRIIGDLEPDLQTLELVKDNYESKLVLGEEVLETLGSDHLEVLQEMNGFQRALAQKAAYADRLQEPFGRKLLLILMIARFSQTQNAYQEMLDTGKIAIIQDDSLKLALQKQYKLLLTTISFQEEIVMVI